jgi:hypothetical protein
MSFDDFMSELIETQEPKVGETGGRGWQLEDGKAECPCGYFLDLHRPDSFPFLKAVYLVCASRSVSNNACFECPLSHAVEIMKNHGIDIVKMY